MKIFKEIKEQYVYLWWWMLEQGIIISALLVNSFLFAIWVAIMTCFYFVMKWLKGH
jgi:hypothetical protein